MKTNVYARSSDTFHILGLHDVSRVFSKIYFQFCHNITFSRYELGHCSLCPPRPPAFSTESTKAHNFEVQMVYEHLRGYTQNDKMPKQSPAS